MASFAFVDNETKKNAILSTIDEEMCKDSGIEPNPEFNCSLYEWTVEVGFAILLNQGGGHVTKENFDKWFDEVKVRDGVNEEQLRKTLEPMKKYLYEKYTFEAWR